MCVCEVSLSFISTNNSCSTRAVLVCALMWSPGKSSMVVDELPQQMRLVLKTYLFFLPMLLCVRGKSRDKGQEKTNIRPNVLILSHDFCVIGWVGCSFVKRLRF